MATENSFDIVSKVDAQEVLNAVDQASKEIRTRFDLKDSHSEIKLEGEEAIQLASSDEYKLKAVTEILQQKLAKRGVSAEGSDLWQDRTSLGLQRSPEGYLAAGDCDREGKRDRQAD